MIYCTFKNVLKQLVYLICDLNNLQTFEIKRYIKAVKIIKIHSIYIYLRVYLNKVALN